MKQKLAFLTLIIILGFNLGLRIYQYRQEYLSQFNPVYWKDRYLKSQWVDPLSTSPIGDDGLYSYTGWEYIHGADPSLLNAEMPPLGKYLIGISILFTHNQNIFALGVGLLFLVIFYKLNILLFKDKLLAFIPVVIFSLEPLYYGQLRAPFLDTLYLTFLLFTFYFLLKGNLLICAIALGLMAATKNTVSTLILVGGVCGFYLLLTKRESIFRFLATLPVSFLMVLLAYFRYFSLGHSLREFLGLQKWIMNFYAIGAKGTYLMVFPMLLFNRWQTWWDGIIKVAEWQITWPSTLLLAIGYWLLAIGKRKIDQFLLLLIWTIVYLLFLCFIPVWPRYFLTLLPFLYIFSLKAIILAIPYVQKKFKF